MNSKALQVFPRNSIMLITPTIAELKSIYSSFSSSEHFDDNNEWLAMFDSMGVDSKFQEKLSILGTKHKSLKEGLYYGYLHQSLQLLPFLQNILLKLGSQGALYISLSTNIDHVSSLAFSQYFEFVVTSKGLEYTNTNGESKCVGILIQYFPIPSENVDLVVKNVTGAGDFNSKV